MAYHYFERLGFVTRLEDLEGVLAPSLYKAILDIDANRERQYLERMDELNDIKDEMCYYEELADERMAQLRNGNEMLEKVIEYVTDTKRLDRNKLVSMLIEVQNDLSNY